MCIRDRGTPVSAHADRKLAPWADDVNHARVSVPGAPTGSHSEDAQRRERGPLETSLLPKRVGHRLGHHQRCIAINAVEHFSGGSDRPGGPDHGQVAVAQVGDDERRWVQQGGVGTLSLIHI